MTEYDTVEGTFGYFAASIMITFVAMAVFTWLMVMYIWPAMVHVYYKAAYVVYWSCRKCIRTTRGHDRSRYTGY